MHDVVIVGGGIAGLAAATQLGRARRPTLVLDTGLARNRFAAHSHGFLTRDGATPAELRAEAGRQLAAYAAIERRAGAAIAAREVAGGFEIDLENGTTVAGRRIILAHGIVDELDWLPGLADCWGRTAIHCPYCHGYEVRDGRLGYLYRGHADLAMLARLYRDWSRDLTVFSDGNPLEPAQRDDLAALGVKLVEAPVEGLLHEEGRLEAVATAAGPVPLDAIFVHAPTRFASPVGLSLGCAVSDGFVGPFFTVDARQQTSVPGVFAAGDAARPMHSVTFAAADGVGAGSAAHHSLLTAI